MIPFRLRIDPSQTSRELVASIQYQYLSAGEVESCGWDRIVSQCTDWPADTVHDPLLAVQNIDENPTFEIDGVFRRLECWENPLYELSGLLIIARPGKESLSLSIYSSDHVLAAETASELLDAVCRKIESFSA
jgi:hypothetical protein